MLKFRKLRKIFNRNAEIYSSISVVLLEQPTSIRNGSVMLHQSHQENSLLYVIDDVMVDDEGGSVDLFNANFASENSV